jgi:2,3-dihydroxyphenylpropionate 1,2-dioxygenase
MPNSEQVMFGCVSHSPIIVIRKNMPAVETRLLAQCAAFKARVEAFDPDYIVMFSNDHFASFHYANMPAFCIGTACEAVADVGGTPGKIPVPEETAMALVDYLRRADFDPAISYHMRVDHGFSQPLSRLLGGIDRWPVIPIFTSVFTRPFISFRRSRLFGEAVGRFVAAGGQRVLILGSGGLSHHPAHYFPLRQDADPKVYGWQLDGQAGGTMTEAEWFNRLLTMHHEGAEKIVAGTRTIADMRLNPAFDQEVLGNIAAGRLAAMDQWDHTEIVAKAGVGALEIQHWIAARAAFGAAGGGAIATNYDMVADYAVGYALAQSEASAA